MDFWERASFPKIEDFFCVELCIYIVKNSPEFPPMPFLKLMDSCTSAPAMLSPKSLSDLLRSGDFMDHFSFWERSGRKWMFTFVLQMNRLLVKRLNEI